MVSHDVVSTTSDIIKKHLEDAVYAHFNMDAVGVEDDVLPDDIGDNIFKTLPDWSTD